MLDTRVSALLTCLALGTAVPAVPTAAAGLQPQQPQSRAAANATSGCTVDGCNFYFLCNEDHTDFSCCANGTRGPGCVGICPDTHCGQVDAAPSMPKELFAPRFAQNLAEYIKFAEDIQIQANILCQYPGEKPSGEISRSNNPKLGTCASQGYKYKHANEPGRRITWGGYPHGQGGGVGPSTVLQKTCLTDCGCCVNTSVLYPPQSAPGLDPPAPECAPDAPKKVPPCTKIESRGICGVCTPSFLAERFIDFYFTTKVQRVCELRDGGGSDPICSAATNPLACLAHPLKCAWRVPTSNGRCISTGTIDGVGPDRGKKCCSVFSSGPTCGFDCNACQAPGVNASIYGGRDYFSACCDQCEMCLATGNGTIATEATCGKNQLNPYPDEVLCAWQSNK